jgi:hypothetical protein
MDRNNVAHLLCAMLTDARSCFNMTHKIVGNPPVSSLDWLVRAMMRSGALPATLGAPLQSFFGRGSGASEGGQATTGNRREEEPRCWQGPPPPNTNVRAKIEAATSAARRCIPAADYYRMVMTVAPLPKPRIITMQLKQAGCVDHLFFGKCATSGCSFKHDGEVDESKIDGAIKKMRAGLAKFVDELNGEEWSRKALNLAPKLSSGTRSKMACRHTSRCRQWP